ncbi:Putative Isoleucyl-tRNA synthetase [Rhizopus microsporus]|nr:Putative Isoleucyl-tRNA synthetase [Rhizopus microsporus]
MGQKYKRDAMKIKKGLPEISSEQIKEFAKTKELVVAGIKVTDEDLNVIRYFEASGGTLYEANTDKDTLILMDVKLYPELEEEGIAREIINRVQRLRKKANLLPTDEISVYYRLAVEATEPFEKILKSQEATLIKVLKKPMTHHMTMVSTETLIIEEEQEVNGIKFDLVFAK